MAWYYTQDPTPPQQPGPYPYPQYPQYQQTPVIITPPIPPNSKPIKPGKGLSAKRMQRIAEDWDKLYKAAKEAEEKKKGKPEEKKKRSGLNWIELSLLLIVVSIPIATIELVSAVMLTRGLSIFK